MKKLITALLFMFAFAAFGQQQQPQEQIDEVMNMTDAEYRIEFRQELTQIPSEMVPLLCVQLELAKQTTSLACVQQEVAINELEQKVCLRLVELIAISIEECKLKAKSLNKAK